MAPTSKHLLIELFECESDRSIDSAYIEKIMKEVAGILGVEVIFSQVKLFETPWSGSGNIGGAAGIMIISDGSYYGIRTLVETGYIGIDLNSCDENINYEKALTFLIRKFGAMKYSASEIKRGAII